MCQRVRMRVRVSVGAGAGGGVGIGVCGWGVCLRDLLCELSEANETYRFLCFRLSASLVVVLYR